MKHHGYANIATAIERITPLHDFVIVERILDDEKKGLVHLPDNARNREEGNRIGRVVAVGRGDKRPPLAWPGPELDYVDHPTRHPMNVKPGDTVIYPRVPANDVEIDGKPYTFLHEQQHVLAVIE